MTTDAPFLLGIYGPTGTGKSDLAELVAAQTDAVTISADAFQVYRGFDIGTNKPKKPHDWLLVDICSPEEGFGAGEFVREALPILQTAWKEKRSVIVAGGTGFYLRALLEEYAEMAGPPDPELRASLVEREQTEGLHSLVQELLNLQPDTTADLRNPVRVRRALERLHSPPSKIEFSLPPFQITKVGLDLPQSQLSDRLSVRLQRMFADGWVEEVEALLAQAVNPRAPAMKAIGYEAITDLVRGSLSRALAEERILVETRQYAKRQRSWMRSEPELQWMSAPLNESERSLLSAEVIRLLKGQAGK